MWYSYIDGGNLNVRLGMIACDFGLSVVLIRAKGVLNNANVTERLVARSVMSSTLVC